MAKWTLQYIAILLLRAVQHRYDAAGVHGGIWLKQYQNELFLVTMGRTLNSIRVKLIGFTPYI